VDGAGFIESWLAGVTDSELVVTAVTAVVEPLLTVVGILLLALLASRLVRRAIRRVVERAREPGSGRLLELGADPEDQRAASIRRAQRTEALGTLADSAARAVIWGFALLTALGTVGIDLAPLIAGAGIVGVAVGFGAQNLVRDLLAGVSMLLEDQYGVGDVIDVGEATGVVEAVGLRTTRLRDLRGTVWHVPNGVITRVGNLTQEWSRAVLDIGVAYDVDVDRAEELVGGILTRFAAEPEQEDVLLEAPELLGVESLADSSVNLRVLLKTRPGEQWATARRLRRAIKREFDAAGLEIPFPQRTVWMRTEPDGAGPAAGQASGPPG
jgi:small-conductance mechanosensitive channel